MPTYYPLHLDLTGRRCLVVGGGPVAERKVAGLLVAGAWVRVLSPAVTPELRRLAEEGQIDLHLQPYDSSLLEGIALAFAATDNAEVNAQIAADAARLNVWVNRADAFEAGDFIVPAVLRRGELCLSLSTGGNHPLLTTRLIAELGTRFGPDYGDYVALLGWMRAEIKARFASPMDRKAAMQALLDAEPTLRRLLAREDATAAHAEAWRTIEAKLESLSADYPPGDAVMDQTER
jgi:precorrin-2 dehydrogenase/sirohydrochlorin ferrochelatase